MNSNQSEASETNSNSSQGSQEPSLTPSDESLNLSNLQRELEALEALDTMSEETFNMDGLSWKVNPTNPTVNETSASGVLYSKEHRPAVGSKLEIDIIKAITENRYEKYTLINTSIKDPESLKTNLSIHARLTATEALWKAYDMLNPCHILFPDPARNNLVPILWPEGEKKGKPKSLYLFKDYRRLSVQDVANSCEYYAKYVTFKRSDGTTGTFSRELAWTYNHFRNHVENNLFETVNSEFIRFNPSQQGGPLFLKLLLDKLVVNNDASLDALITTATTYNIKTMSENEDIMEVTKLLDSVSNTIVSLRNDQEYELPEKYVQKMLKVLQTTSVNGFNHTFSMLEDQLTFNRRLKNSLNSPTMLGLGHMQITNPSNNWTLDNSPRSLLVLWTFARSTYSELQTNGEWDSALRPHETEQPQAHAVFTVTCFNCGGPHTVVQCTEVLNEERIEKNRKEFLQKKKLERQSKRKGKPVPRAWRPPEPDEHGKRVIYGKPYTWNEAHHGWDKDDTPETGLSTNTVSTTTSETRTDRSDACNPAAHGFVARSADDDHTVLTQSTIPAHELAQLQLDLANLQQAFSRYG